MTAQEQIRDAYAEELDIMGCSYDMMGKMLDTRHVQRKLSLLGVDELYIYGGGYLGIQFYRTVHDIVQILAVVDKSGGLLLDIPDIPVVNIEEFRKKYNGQKVVITPVKFYQEIYRDLSSFVPLKQLVYLGELLGGSL